MSTVNLSYSKWDPNGNITLFLSANAVAQTDQAQVAKQALTTKGLEAEQVGFIDCHTNTLRMAGGEFCLNATTAFAAHLQLQQSKPALQGLHLNVCGFHGAITAHTHKIASKSVEVILSLHLEQTTVKQITDSISIVELPSITHVLIHGQPPTDAEALLLNLIDLHHLETCPCVGVVWWNNCPEIDTYAITPLVYVRDVHTTIWEQACGSGSLALTLCLDNMHPGCMQIPKHIVQPSQGRITCSYDHATHTAICKSTAHLMQEGSVTLTI
ncbi:MAG: hypothetical protein IJU79_05510 [Desulfovibrionaceae bacterium]|nr:hypothetical protein [Desulfovibrionaceae bacterium]